MCIQLIVITTNHLIRRLHVIIIGLLFAALLYSKTSTSFLESKHFLRDLRDPVLSQTFYCQVPIDRQGVALSCPQGWSEDDCKVEWDHIVPASFLGKKLPCWGTDVCSIDLNWSHRRCCQETSVEFRFREANVMNLVPVLRKLNREKSHFLPGVVQDKKHVKNLCGLKIDRKKKIFEPPDWRKGWVARVYLRMDEYYQLALSTQQRALLEQWNKAFPEDEEEKRYYTLLNLSS